MAAVQVTAIYKPSRAKQVADAQKNASVDAEPWSDIKDTPEDRELYPDDWMKKICMDQTVYKDLLARVESHLKEAVPWMHPNKVLWVTLRHLVTGDSCTPAEESVVLKAGEIFRKAMPEEYDPDPNNFRSFEEEFDSIWNVQNCLGSIAGRRLKSQDLDIHTHYSGTKVDSDVFLLLLTDARLRIWYCVNATGPGDSMFESMLNKSNLTRAVTLPGIIPEPKAVNGSHKKVPYTFVSGNQFPARPWLRVPSSGKDDKEVNRGIRPAEITMDILVSRFGYFQLKHPTSCLGGNKLTSCIITLHNYFLRTNPKYANLHEVINDYLKKPVTVPKKEAPKKVPAKKNVDNGKKVGDGKNVDKVKKPFEDSDWMIRMKMDDKVFQELLKMTEPHLEQFSWAMKDEEILQHAMEYVATGAMPSLDHESLFAGSFIAITKALEEYKEQLPFTQDKWRHLASEFEDKMKIPNCVGVIATRRLTLPALPGQEEDRIGIVVMICDANYRISHAELVNTFTGTASASSAVDQVLRKNESQWPEGKSYVFVGREGMQKHPYLVVPGLSTTYSESQLDRALRLSERVVDVLFNRFGIIDRSTDKTTATRVFGASMAFSVLHNFFMDKSPAYSAGFKN